MVGSGQGWSGLEVRIKVGVKTTAGGESEWRLGRRELGQAGVTAGDPVENKVTAGRS